jgi:hypothetical protein
MDRFVIAFYFTTGPITMRNLPQYYGASLRNFENLHAVCADDRRALQLCPITDIIKRTIEALNCE